MISTVSNITILPILIWIDYLISRKKSSSTTALPPLLRGHRGTEKVGIHNAGINGVFARGVLIDMPKHLAVEGLFNPLHELALVGLGMPILDNLDLKLLG